MGRSTIISPGAGQIYSSCHVKFFVENSA